VSTCSYQSAILRVCRLRPRVGGLLVVGLPLPAQELQVHRPGVGDAVEHLQAKKQDHEGKVQLVRLRVDRDRRQPEEADRPHESRSKSDLEQGLGQPRLVVRRKQRLCVRFDRGAGRSRGEVCVHGRDGHLQAEEVFGGHEFQEDEGDGHADGEDGAGCSLSPDVAEERVRKVLDAVRAVDVVGAEVPCRRGKERRRVESVGTYGKYR